MRYPVECVDASGNKTWRLSNGVFHRLDGPAIIWPDGYQTWCQWGANHRLDGPAVIAQDYQQWWVDGMRHRLDGPAIIFEDGRVHWWVNDKMIDAKVLDWIQENDLPDWKLWDDDIWALFRLRFS